MGFVPPLPIPPAILERPSNEELDIIIRPAEPSLIDAAWMWLTRLLENVCNFVGFHSPADPDLDAIQWPLSSDVGKYDSHVPLLPQIALDLLAQAVAASAGITLSAKPQYEEMLHSPPDWRPLHYCATFPECGDE